ncbi:hypothetical protein PC118_g17401 [Phytophthora cactorum]|uniref:Uncharacterized protein n=1 Tax=Phytophthora cactorum TaxID=29920 RepID=A0A8T1FBZ7_9STRA|nr:hypothetical protein PC111_g22869 [Phytophthora cactorum]KAG2794277.1 hypothetical protein PC112_g23105 [Phytophthora cactorum]KAG2817199.1 hypothetical protein PC113_g23000 [Phytophthora cactorum]KAG2969532.1 hypothetical protein PC118_g17401 [Phytophthora cactorum]KAG3126026.1 hypothetical protein C6341_g25534 [Phytophthora cactorum]
MLSAPRPAAPATFPNSQVANFYFRPCRDHCDEIILEYCRCRCGTVRKRVAGTGFTNLMEHIRRERPSFAEEMLAATPGQTGSVVHYVSQTAQNTFGWLELLVKCNLPLSFCESKLARRSLKSVSVETIRRVMEAVARAVERSIAAELPKRFGLVFDGWSHDSEQFIAVFAWYEVDGAVHCPLLCMAPLVSDETDDLSAATHHTFLGTMLTHDYGKSVDQCIFLVGDNCSVNRRLADLIGVPLVGCTSHKLNRADSQQVSVCAEDLISDQAVMVKLRTLHHSAKLRFQTEHTHWGSSFATPSQNFELLPFIDSEDEELAELLPHAASKRRLHDLLGELKDVESVSKALQGSNVDLLDVRVWFDGLITEMPSYARYRAPRADIVHSPDFEAGCVLVLKGQAKRLTRAEKAALESFMVDPRAQDRATDEEEADASASFVKRIQENRRLDERQPSYELLASIPPTSNIVERFISIAQTTDWDARTVESAG